MAGFHRLAYGIKKNVHKSKRFIGNYPKAYLVIRQTKH